MDWKEKLGKLDFESMLEEKVLFPFLFVTYFVLSMYLSNIEMVKFTETLLPVGIILAGTGVFYYSLKYLIGDKGKAGIIVFIFALAGFTYGPQKSLLLGLDFPGIYLFRRRNIIIANVIIAFILSIEVYRRDLNLKPAVKTANFLTLVLFSIVAFNILLAGSTAQGNSDIDNNMNIEAGEIVDKPDIYYLIPDRYARNDVLKEYYGFDNSYFTDNLKEKGFYIANESYGNYPSKTTLSISSSLNMQYHQDMGTNEKTRSKDIQPLIQDHQIQKFLKKQGYDYYHTSFNFQAAAYNRNADQNINNHLEISGIQLKRFHYYIFKETLVGATFTSGNVFGQRTDATINNFKDLQKMPKKESPKLVIGHFKTPHHPFTLDENAENLGNNNLSTEEKYIKQIQATNKLLNETVKKILEKEENSVIIIQSDEGPVPPGEVGSFSGAETDREKIRKSGIINSYYTPGMNQTEFYPRITPVNSFRKIFNHYFNTNLEILEDRVYHHEADSGRYNFTELDQDTLY